MMHALHAEFRKLLSVRSTYVIFIICLLIVALFAGFGDGYRATPAALRIPNLLTGESRNAITIVGLILAFVGMLLVAHEYRYNTIMYTLTASNRRLKVLGAKFIAISVFAVVTALIMIFFAPFCTIVGAHLHGYTIGPQDFPFWPTIWHTVFVGWGYAAYAFILIVILRSQVGSIVVFLLIPLIGENIISHIFTKSTQYLPFTMLQAVASTNHPEAGGATVGHAVAVSLAYVIVGLVVSTVLFMRRDAN